jgi:serine-type D-Ala-D-Ala carboxypeptidase/endopeptidase (penicillin-binding protein 4)
MSGRLSAAVLSLSLLLACRGTPAPSHPPRPFPTVTRDEAVESLQRRVAALLADAAVAAGTWGVEVRSLAAGDHLVDVNAHRLLTPASTMKTVTLAIAADQLGWDYTYETRVVPTGTVSNGTLDGDLVVLGSGDPSFDDWDGAASAVFQTWAARLKELGISTIGGRIVGNDDVFGDEGLGAGWMWDDMAFAYSAPASGLQFNEGSAQVIITPGEAVGEPAVLALSPSHARVPLVNETRTGAAGSGTSIAMQALPRIPGARIAGTIALDSGRQVRNVSVGNPTLYFANAVRTGLLANGVDVLGGAVDADDLVDPPVADAAAAMLTYRSPALSSLADTLMKLSQNLYAETFLRTLGRERGQGGTGEAGGQVVRQVLASWGVPESEVVMADGSGLSRYDLVTADAMVSVLAHVYADARLRGPYVAALPIAGRAGTLSARMRGTAAEGNVQAKTGSFTNARAVAGFVRTADGEPLAFSIMANNYGVSPDSVDRITDAVIVALAEFSRH